MTNPVDDEDLYTSFVLGGVASPGVVKSLTGHDIEAKWDVKKGVGQAGATTTMTEKPPRTPSITIYLADRDDFAAWPAFQALIESTVSDAAPKPLDIYYPDLSDARITSVCQGKISGVVHDGKGGQTRTISFQEYLPPKKAGGTPKGSVAKPKNDPNQAALDELSKLTKQYQETPWG